MFIFPATFPSAGDADLDQGSGIERERQRIGFQLKIAADINLQPDHLIGTVSGGTSRKFRVMSKLLDKKVAGNTKGFYNDLRQDRQPDQTKANFGVSPAE